MTPKRQFELFKEYFNWFADHVVSYKVNKNEGGIDISLDTGETLNFIVYKDSKYPSNRTWILRRK